MWAAPYVGATRMVRCILLPREGVLSTSYQTYPPSPAS